MSDFKFGISDENEGEIEGTIIGTPVIIDNGKLAINFVINSDKHVSGVKKGFQYELVVFDPYASRVREILSEGQFVRCRYHLMAVDHYCRPVVDYMQIEEYE